MVAGRATMDIPVASIAGTPWHNDLPCIRHRKSGCSNKPADVVAAIAPQVQPVDRHGALMLFGGRKQIKERARAPHHSSGVQPLLIILAKRCPGNFSHTIIILLFSCTSEQFGPPERPIPCRIERGTRRRWFCRCAFPGLSGGAVDPANHRTGSRCPIRSFSPATVIIRIDPGLCSY